MNWQNISNVSSVVTILSALFSGLSWYKTKSYYNKIAKNNSFEKLSSLDKDLEDIRNLYENIKKFHLTASKRGTNPQKIIDMHLDMESKLNQIRNTLPSKYKDILKCINTANAQIDFISDKELHFENNSSFRELGTFLKNIEDGIKIEKENLRGY